MSIPDRTSVPDMIYEQAQMDDQFLTLYKQNEELIHLLEEIKADIHIMVEQYKKGLDL